MNTADEHGRLPCIHCGSMQYSDSPYCQACGKDNRVLPRDPSVRDVLAQLDRIEAKIDKLLEPKRRVASDGSWVETS